MNRTLIAREDALQLLKFHLLRAQNRMTQQANKHRNDRNFPIGDLVLLKLHPYRQVSLKHHHVHKLLPKYFGPFKILDRIGSTAYQLKLPPSTTIHNVFHVSQLKLCPNPPSTPLIPILDTISHVPANTVPESIVDRKMVRRGRIAATKALVKGKIVLRS